MRISISTTDITVLLISCTWNGDITQAARKLDFSFIQSDIDENVPVINADCGVTVRFYDDAGELIFQGNICEVEKSRKNSSVKITALDNNFIANRSKITRKFDNATPASITRSICSEIGIKTGSIISTGETVSFIAHNKTAYQAIQQAFEEAGKKNGKHYQIIMRGDELNVIESGESSEVLLDSEINLLESVYKKNTENVTNAVAILDEQGNATGEVISNSDSVNRYSMVMDTYKTQKNKNAQEDARAKLKSPELEATVEALGDFRCIAGKSVTVRDSLLQGKFKIKSDNHTLRAGQHTMRLVLEFEELINA